MPHRHEAADGPTPITTPLTILCPLRLEARPLRRLARRYGWRVQVIGIGTTATVRAVESLEEPGPVVLAGTAGALRRSLPSGSAHFVGEVVTTDGLLISPMVQEGLRVTGADAVVATPEDKTALSELTGADLVDMESPAFARASQARGLSWGIVRGISDGVDHHMPANAHRWFGPDGGIRPVRAALDLVIHPSDLRLLVDFHRRARTAMTAVGEILAQHFATTDPSVE